MDTDTHETMLEVLEAIEEFHGETYGCGMRDQHALALYMILSYLWNIMCTLVIDGKMTKEQSEWFNLVKKEFETDGLN